MWLEISRIENLFGKLSFLNVCQTLVFYLKYEHTKHFKIIAVLFLFLKNHVINLSKFQVLPQRIQEWKSSPCIAEEHDMRQLEKIRKQQLEARHSLQELDQKHQVEYDNFI